MAEALIRWCIDTSKCLNGWNGLLTILSLTGLYLSSLAVYRLTLSPLRRYPGPKLAALTQWYETYHELRGDGGQFIFKIDELHEQYGPMVRISPHEVHIRDSDLYESFYATSHVADRPAALAHRFGIPLSSHFTSDHSLHRKRRAAMNPLFSKRKAASFAPTVQETMDRLCAIIQTRYADAGKELNLNAMWGCIASDMVAKYSLGISFNFIETDNFDSTFVKGMANLLEPLHIITQFPLIGSFMRSLPDSISIKLQPDMEAVVKFKSKVTEQVRAVLESSKNSSEDAKSGLSETVPSTVLHSKLPPFETSLERLREECIGVTAAGVETIYRALTVGTYYILMDKSVQTKLEQELKAAISDAATMPSYETLLKLPYLSACVKEVERIGIGTSQRSPRIFRRTTPDYASHPLVLNHAFSMSIRDVHFDPVIFPEPERFEPSRWLPADFTPDGQLVESAFQPIAPSGKPLSRYLVPYARGSRNCIGMHLADVEIRIGLTTLFRRFAGKVSMAPGVGPETVGIWKDRFVPREKPGAGSVRALIDT